MKFYGIDLHHDNFKMAIIDENNQFITKRIKLYSKDYNCFMNNLDKNDNIALESSTNSFWFYEQVKDKVDNCFIINNWKFNDSKKINNKNDKIDAKKIAKKLRYRILSGGDEEDLPTIYVPEKKVQGLRSLFTTYNVLNKEKTIIKNRTRSLLVQHGYCFSSTDIFNKKMIAAILNLELSESIKFQIRILYNQVEFLENQIKEIKNKILEEEQIFQNEIELLVSIEGISVFMAIGIMTDIADINRFDSGKKLSSYLRTAPKINSSNKSYKIGYINRQSRKLSLSLLTQGLVHICKSSDYIYDFYQRKKVSRKTGRARIAVARKTFRIIYVMLRNNQYYRFINKINHERKIKEYKSFLNRVKKREKRN